MEDGLLLHNIKQDRCSLEMDKGNLVRHIFVAEKQRFSLYLGDETRAAPLAFFHKELFEVNNKMISVSYIEHLKTQLANEYSRAMS